MTESALLSNAGTSKYGPNIVNVKRSVRETLTSRILMRTQSLAITFPRPTVHRMKHASRKWDGILQLGPEKHSFLDLLVNLVIEETYGYNSNRWRSPYLQTTWTITAWYREFRKSERHPFLSLHSPETPLIALLEHIHHKTRMEAE